MAIGRRSMELRSGRAGGDALTAATLLEAERAPTARVLCRTAFRNMLEVCGASNVRENNCNRVAIARRGD
jgi:hypothetical protein